MSKRVIVIVVDPKTGEKINVPLAGKNTTNTLKLPVDQQEKIFYDVAKKTHPNLDPVSFGEEGKQSIPFSRVTKPQPAPEVKPAPAPEVKPAPAPEVKPAPAPEVKPAPAPEVRPPEPDSRINDLTKEWEEKAKEKAREAQAAKERADQAAKEKAEADRKAKEFQDLITKKEKEAAEAKTKQEAEKKAKELEALRAQEEKTKADAEAKAAADAKAKAEADKKAEAARKAKEAADKKAEADAKAAADAKDKAEADKKNTPTPAAPSRQEPTPAPTPAAPGRQDPAPTTNKPPQANTQPGKWDTLRKELGIDGPVVAQPSKQPGTSTQPSVAIPGTTSNTPGPAPGKNNGPGKDNGPATVKKPDPAQIRPDGRLPGDGYYKDLGDGTQIWVGPAGIDPVTGQKVQTGTRTRTPVWKGDDDLSKKFNPTDLEAIRADIRRQRRELEAQRKKLQEAARKGPKKK